MRKQTVASVVALALIAAQGLAHADMVKSGEVVRGLELKGQAGPSGTPTGTSCDFSGEPVNQAGRMEGASVNCKKGGKYKDVVKGLPRRFNAVCVTDAPISGARLMTAEMPDNRNHCDLSGITRQDATQQFGGAVWR